MSTTYNFIGYASFTIQKPVKTERTKACDLCDELGRQNKSQGAGKGENQLAATIFFKSMGEGQDRRDNWLRNLISLS